MKHATTNSTDGWLWCDFLLSKLDMASVHGVQTATTSLIRDRLSIGGPNALHVGSNDVNEYFVTPALSAVICFRGKRSPAV